MRFAAKDGSMHASQKAAYDAGSQSKAPGKEPAGDPTDYATTDDGSQDQQSIEDNPQAMQMVDDLKQMGYTAEDVARAMDADGGGAAPAAPQIPGMQ